LLAVKLGLVETRKTVMTETTHSSRRRSAPPILQNAFRPFFLGAALVAGVSVLIWAAVYLGWAGDLILGVEVHVHEMLYGFLAAMVCGFALTAIPNWTGRAPVAGWSLAALFALWLAGRGQIMVSHWVVEAVDVMFLPAVAGVAFIEIISGRNWRNLPISVLLAGFAISHFAFHFGPDSATAIRATFAVASLLIALIGGRITPSFTRNWLASRGGSVALPVPMNRFDSVALIVLAIAVVSWIAMPVSIWTGGLLMAGGALQLVRLSRWSGLQTIGEPLIWSMHLGFAWLGVGLGLIGAGLLWPTIIPANVGLHALAAGAFGSMGLAVMTRASLGHTGRARSAGPATSLIFGLVHLGALARVVGAWQGNEPIWLAAGAGLWSAAFLVFVIVYAPTLWAPKAS
jgi:uncharacterized protein involved in response to NO